MDGLTDAGIWEDDDSEHVVVVTFQRDPKKAPAKTHTLRLVLTDQAVPFALPEGGPMTTPPPTLTITRTAALIARLVTALARATGNTERAVRLEFGIDQGPEAWAEDFNPEPGGSQHG